MQFYLSSSRWLRFVSFTTFYLAQGFPIGLISIALPAWLAGQGASAAEVASFVAITGLPWGFKLLAGPVMDRFSFLAMGRRRPWVIGAQGLLVLAIVAMAFVPDPANNVVLLSAAGFMVNSFAAIQDVAVDGMAIDVLEENERGRANAFMAFGQVAGYSGSGALSGLVLVQAGLPGACLLLAVGVFFIFSWSIVVREREGERRFPWSEGEASERAIALQATDWMSILGNLMRVLFLPASILLMLMALMWRIQSGFWISATPVIVVSDLGYASTDYSSWSATAGFIAAVLGLLFGPLIDRFGSRRFLLAALLAMGVLHIVTSQLTDYWHMPSLILTVLFADQFFGQIIFIAFIALHMNICWGRVSATQFAIYMAWTNLARSIGAWLYGLGTPHFERGDEFIVMGIVCLIGAGLLMLVDLNKHAGRIEALDRG